MLQYERQVIGIPLHEVRVGDRIGVDGQYGIVTSRSTGYGHFINVLMDVGGMLTIRGIDFDQPVRVWRRK